MTQQEQILNWLYIGLSQSPSQLNEIFYFDKRDNEFFSVLAIDYFMFDENMSIAENVKTNYSKVNLETLTDRIKRIHNKDISILALPRLGSDAAEESTSNQVELFLKHHGININTATIWEVEESANINIDLSVNKTEYNGEKSDDDGKYIKSVSVFLSVIFLYKLINEFNLLWFTLTDERSKWDFSVLIFIFPFVLLPASAILFWRRKKTGWTLATVYSSYSVIGNVQLLFFELNRKPSGIPALDALFPATSPAVYCGAILLFGAVTWGLCRSEIRSIFGADNKSILKAIGMGAGIILLMNLMY